MRDRLFYSHRELAMEYYLYILYSRRIDRYYIGVSSDPPKRLNSHNNYPTGWTKRGIPWELVFQKEFVSKQVAMRWEKFIKNQKRRDIIELITNGDFNWD